MERVKVLIVNDTMGEDVDDEGNQLPSRHYAAHCQYEVGQKLAERMFRLRVAKRVEPEPPAPEAELPKAKPIPRSRKKKAMKAAPENKANAEAEDKHGSD